MTRPSMLADTALLETNRKFLDYWAGKFEGDRMPMKRAVDPTEIPKLLPALVIYERLSADRFQIRLAGTEVVRRIGVNPTGGNIFDLLAPESREMVREALNRILDEPCGHHSRVRDRYPSGREAVVEVLRLPLLSDAGEPRFIISSTAEMADPNSWADPQEKPWLLAQLIQQRFFSWGEAEQPGPDRSKAL